MHKNNALFWLASYPKSGNTWFRIVLTNLLTPSATPISLNQIHTGAIASSRAWVDAALGFDSALLTHNEIDNLRPDVYRWYGASGQGISYHKIHDAYTYLDAEQKKPLIPPNACDGALYFIRNPLDVAISFANHSRCTIDEAIGYMGNEHYAFCKSQQKQHYQLRQWLLSWSMHVQSWSSAPQLNVLVIRYEDMKHDPFATFSKAIQFLQLEPSPDALANAIANASIDKLQQQEAEFGFNEKPAKVAHFFRKGIVGDWRNTLSEAQISRIIQDHGQVMQEYGYVDDNMNPYY